MTPFIAAYLAVLTLTTFVCYRVGEARDVIAVWSLWLAQGPIYAALMIPGASIVGVTGVVWLIHAATLFWFFSRPADTWIAVFSAGISVMAALALFGMLPSERGQGVAANFWHFSTLATYGQLGVLWISAGIRYVRAS